MEWKVTHYNQTLN